ncbi:SNF1-related protein kinase regulatory subunit gamma-1-like [Arachis duranensis]|uniref:SNF1-related protein kinase regulatory subunit gamma-1-like n=1 Tax=Arachis duranensis TaxID=130453 RepID=A0A9C6WVU7_ARADU|nr:SNF1-related protein kinase regulatory subunit gamma-1-like [Arachis duranensis]
MAQEQECRPNTKDSKFDTYFETIQSRKKLPETLQESLTDAFAKIPVSSFPKVPGGKVIEISADSSVGEAVKILSESNILAAPVKDPNAGTSSDWRNRYLGIIDYSAIILWVLESAELAAIAISAGTATAAGVGAGTIGALGALALGVTGPAAIAGLTAAAVGAAVAGGVAADKGIGKDAPLAAANLGEDFYKVLLEEEPFKSTTVRSILKSYRWAPFVPVATNSVMLTVLLLLSKYRLRNVPVIEPGKPDIVNFITQSAVVQGLEGCRGRDWFDCIADRSISFLGLPFMSSEEVICIQSNELVLEAFKLMRDNQIGGLPCVQKLTVNDFMNKIAAATQETGKIARPITCKPDATLGSVIHTLSSQSIHRIYAVNEQEELVGVITLRDVISCFINEPSYHFDDYYGFAANEMLNH